MNQHVSNVGIAAGAEASAINISADAVDYATSARHQPDDLGASRRRLRYSVFS